MGFLAAMVWCAAPQIASAGGVDVFLGVNLPLPVVAVAPAPVVVAPAPVVVRPAPVVVHRPVVVRPAPVVVSRPVVIRERPAVVYYDGYPRGHYKKWCKKRYCD